MDELMRDLARLGAAGVMSAVNIWVLWFLLTQAQPKMEERHLKGMERAREEFRVLLDSIVRNANVARQDMLAALDLQQQTFAKVVDQIAAQALRQMEVLERRHSDLLARLDRLSSRLEEVNHAIELGAAGAPNPRPAPAPATEPEGPPR